MGFNGNYALKPDSLGDVLALAAAVVIFTIAGLFLFQVKIPRACLKNACAGWAFHFVGGKERFWARSWCYAPQIATHYTAKWGVQNGAMIFQTRSSQVKRKIEQKKY